MTTIFKTAHSLLQSTNRDALSGIHQPDYQIGIWQRSPEPGLAAEAKALAESQWAGLRFSGEVLALPEALAVPYLSLALQADALSLAEWFAHLCGTAQVRLFFGSVRSDMCRRFHTDMVSLRLLCTYAGPGTLWAETAAVSAKHLAKGSNEQIIEDVSGVHQVPTGQVCLLKGALHEHSRHGAVLHRSPSIEEEGQARLILRIDANHTIF